jgi:pantothenate kinase
VVEPSERPHSEVESLSLSQLVQRAAALCKPGHRSLLGITGAPGAGKSTLAAALVDALGAKAALLPMDGFHLADEELSRLGRSSRKGAIDTFDGAGYVHTLRRLREQTDEVVYAPVFMRERELAIAGALPFARDLSLIITEGNYVLSDGPFRPVRDLLTESWFLTLDPRIRRQRLIDRHVRYGRSPDEAQAWVDRTDERNASLIEVTRSRADLSVKLTESQP